MAEPIPSTHSAPEDAEIPAREPAVSLRCPGCGADLTWDPDADALTCSYCGARQEIPREDRTILERPLEAALDAPRGLGCELRVLRCETCGARVALEERTTSETCVFCGSANVLAQEANRNAIRPESLIPLDVGRAKVEAAFRQWISKGWFRPGALKRIDTFEALGIYVPAWTFDCRVHSIWSAQSGTYYYVSEHYTTVENGKTVTKTRQAQKVRWWPSAGEREDAFDDHQVLASRGVSRELATALGPFDTHALVPYSPEYLAGWRAEEYELDLEAAWKEAAEQIAAVQRGRCASDVPGDTHRNLNVRNDISAVRWKHVLLPLWSLTYTFGGKSWPVLVHGQSGNIVGKKPLSWQKIVLFVLFVLLLGGAIAVAVAVLGGAPPSPA